MLILYEVSINTILMMMFGYMSALINLLVGYDNESSRKVDHIIVSVINKFSINDSINRYKKIFVQIDTTFYPYIEIWKLD